MTELARTRTTGQSLWLNQVSRGTIEDGSMIAHIEDLSITGATVTPEGVCSALSNSPVYDHAIKKKLKAGLVGEQLVLSLILEDVHYAADMLRHVFDRTDGLDGWAVLPISPLIPDDTDSLLSSVLAMQSEVKRPNTLITVRGLPSNLTAIEEITFAGIPCNIASIYSNNQFLSVADACLRGVERRIAAGLKPAVSTFISFEISLMNTAFREEMQPAKATHASINLARQIYKTSRQLHTSQRWERVYNEGARALRLVWVGPKNGQEPDMTVALFNHLVAPLTVMALSERDLKELLLEEIGLVQMYSEKGAEKDVASNFNFDALSVRLQKKEEALQIKTWMALLEATARRSAELMATQPGSI